MHGRDRWMCTTVGPTLQEIFLKFRINDFLQTMSDSVHYTSDFRIFFSIKALSCQQRNCLELQIVLTKEKQTQNINWKPNLKLMLPFPVWAELNCSLLFTATSKLNNAGFNCLNSSVDIRSNNSGGRLVQCQLGLEMNALRCPWCMMIEGI